MINNVNTKIVTYYLMELKKFEPDKQPTMESMENMEQNGETKPFMDKFRLMMVLLKAQKSSYWRTNS